MLALQREQQGERDAGASGICGQRESLGRHAAREQPAVRGQGILEPLRERIFRRQAKLGQQDPGLGGQRERASMRAIAVRRGRHERSAMEVQDGRLHDPGRRHQQRRRPARDHRPHLGARWLSDSAVHGLRRGTRVVEQRLDAVEPLLRLPHPGDSAEQLAAERHRGAHRLIDVAQHPPGPVQQRVAHDRELDPMGGAPQELGSNQLFEPANLATERGRRHVQPIRGAREAELLGDGDERPQVAQLDPVARSRKWERGLCRFVVTHDSPRVISVPYQGIRSRR